jgi:hypothetical protein
MAYPHLTLPDDIGEVSAQHPITLDRLRAINARAATSASDEAPQSSSSAANSRDTPAEMASDQPSHSSSSAANDSNSPSELANGSDEPPQSINSNANDSDSPAESSSSSSEDFDSSSDPGADLDAALQQDDPIQVSTPFVAHIMSELQAQLERSVQIEVNASPLNAQRLAKESAQLAEGLEAMRKIYSAWSKYPPTGGTIDGAVISLTDYSNTAVLAVRGAKTHSLPRRIARLMAKTIDPSRAEGEVVGTLVHEQRRIDDCMLAMEQQYAIWKTQVQPDLPLTGDELVQELTSDAAAPITYTMQPPHGELSAPSKPGDFLAASNLAAMAEDEAHDSMQIFVSGKVLKTKAEKASDLAGRLAAAKAAEAKEAKEARAAEAEALKGSKAAKGRAGKKSAFAASSDVEEGDEIIRSRSARKASKATPRKRATSALANETGKGKKKVVPRKRTKVSEDMVVSSDDGNDAQAFDSDDADSGKVSKKTVRPRKSAQNDDAASEANANDDSSDESSSSSEDDSSGNPPPICTVAPNKRQRGGAAPKWLHDEDNLGRQIIQDNPKMPMPAVWRKFNIELANTAFKTDKMSTHDYRSDWIPSPRVDSKGRRINDKKARKLDICHRSYESLRQHLEKHKARVNDKSKPQPVTWAECTKNPVSHLPKRAPPPRPTYFSDGRTLVDPPTMRRRPGPGNNAAPNLPSAPSGYADDTPTSTFNGKQYFQSSGWAAINNPVSGNFSSIGSFPSEQPKRKRAAKGKGEAELSQLSSSPYPGSSQFMQPQNDSGHLRSDADEDNSWMANLPSARNFALASKVPETLEDFVADQSDDEDEQDDEQAQVQRPMPSLFDYAHAYGQPSGQGDDELEEDDYTYDHLVPAADDAARRVSRSFDPASSTRGNRGAGVPRAPASWTQGSRTPGASKASLTSTRVSRGAGVTKARGSSTRGSRSGRTARSIKSLIVRLKVRTSRQLSLEDQAVFRAALTKLSQSNAPPPHPPTTADSPLAYLIPDRFPSARRLAAGAGLTNALIATAASAPAAATLQQPIDGTDLVSNSAPQAGETATDVADAQIEEAAKTENDIIEEDKVEEDQMEVDDKAEEEAAAAEVDGDNAQEDNVE